MTKPQGLRPFTLPRTGRQASNRTALAAMTNEQSHAKGSLSEDESAGWSPGHGAVSAS